MAYTESVDIYTADRIPTGEVLPREGIFLKEGQFMLYALALIQNREGKYLITQRAADKSWGAGWWEISGGGVLMGETSIQAVTREIGEEVGLDARGVEPELLYTYTNVDLKHGSNYITDIYRFTLDFTEADVVLQEEEAQACKLATWEEIQELGKQGIFLHYARLCQALGVAE